MVQGLIDQVQRFAAGTHEPGVVARHGIITSYDPNNHAVKVELQPEGTLTGWMPLKSSWVGNGWGMFAAPMIGEAIEVDFQEGHINAGTAGHRFFNDEERPLPVPAGEFWLVHKSGASFKLTNDGALAVDDGKGASVRLNGDGTITSAATAWNHTGPLNVTGGDVVADGISLKTHKTTLVSPGSGLSGVPE